jgi:hypothetical protein
MDGYINEGSALKTLAALLIPFSIFPVTPFNFDSADLSFTSPFFEVVSDSAIFSVIAVQVMGIATIGIRKYAGKFFINPFKKRIEEMGMTIEEVVTLASMIEKETARADERAVIASVFLNRLKKGIRLASDPTVIYGIKDFDGNLTRKDLGRPTPYNTYLIQGLPPGPIANPGLDAIRAVLYPAHTDYLYFVSKNDGSHFFSKTYKEHKKAVRIYQQKRRKSVIKNGG